jgi:hypothetical protein
MAFRLSLKQLKVRPIATLTLINNPQETFPLKKPIPTDTIAKAAKALPAGPETMFITLQISLIKTSLADALEGKINAVRNRDIQKRVICR